MSCLPRILLLLCLLPGCIRMGYCQERDKWQYEARIHAGANLFLTNVFGRSGHQAFKFPGVRAFASISMQANYGHLLLHYGPSVSVYYKTIGSNLNRFNNDIQMDFTHSVNLGFISKKNTGYLKLMRTMHNGDYYNLQTNRKFLFAAGTNILFNNHKRHQIIGSLNLNFERWSINYYNDGPPFNSVALGDGFDRYWTGGGHIIYHGQKNTNIAELSYDQFTGYAPLLYELSNILGIYVPVYENDRKQDGRLTRNFNTSAYHLKINGNQYFDFDAGIIGNLVTKNQTYFGIQDIIHLRKRMSLHPNNDINRVFIGGSFKKFYEVRL